MASVSASHSSPVTSRPSLANFSPNTQQQHKNENNNNSNNNWDNLNCYNPNMLAQQIDLLSPALESPT